MSCQECKALGIFFKEHLSEVTVSESDLTAVSDRSRDAESLKPDSDGCCSFGSLAAVLLDSDGSTDYICPLCVLKADRLDAFDEFIDVKTCSFRDLSALLDGGNAIFLQNCQYLRFSSVIGFK